MEILFVIGTRPEAIKMAPLVNALRNDSEISSKVCVTGQHREMLDQVLDIFEITPDIDFNLMTINQDLSDITSLILTNLRDLFRDINPDLVLVHGDTTTCFAASLAAFYSGTKIGHVEAGLRTNNIFSPFPEEMNRRFASLVADYHFAPTYQSQLNLLNEGIHESKIIITGNTVIDSLFAVLEKLKQDKVLSNEIDAKLSRSLNFDWKNSKFILITGHRRENFGQGFKEICSAIKDLASTFTDIHFVYPVHLNPNVREAVNNMLLEIDNIHLIDPLEYTYFTRILDACYLVLTDSGGIQEEAPSLGKPVLVMRDVTERPEAVQAGTVKLVGAKKQSIFDEVSKLISDQIAYSKMSGKHNPYGDGKACKRIIEFIKKEIMPNE